MSAEPKERDAGSWAGKISLATLIAVVFAAGILYQKLDTLADVVKDVVPRIGMLERWVAAHDARRRR